MPETENPGSGKLRPATIQDADILLQWRNHSTIRKFMNNSQNIDMHDHLAWLKGIIADKSRFATLLYIYEVSGNPCGFMKYVPEQNDESCAEWGFYSAPDAPPGTGSSMCRTALDKAFGELGFNKIIGRVLPFNTRSLKLHEKLGFTKLAEQSSLPDMDDTNQNHVCFEISSTQWLQASKNQVF